jgi:hypothetical protein
MTRDLAMMGFVGILIDRAATNDGGRALERRIASYVTGERSSSDQRWVYYSLSPVITQVMLNTTAEQRAARITEITGVLDVSSVSG